MKLKQTLIALMLAAGFVVIFVSPIVFADCAGVKTSVISCTQPGGAGPVQNTGIWGILLVVLNVLTAGVGIAAVGGVVYGSIIYTTAEGSLDKVKKARVIIANTVVGILLYVLMYSFLNYIIPGGIFVAGTGTPVVVSRVTTPKVITPKVTKLPTAPTPFSAKAYNGYVSMYWSASSGDIPIKSYEIQRRVSNNNDKSVDSWKSVKTLNGSQLQYRDSTVVGGKSYEYQIIATDNIGNKSVSLEADNVAFVPTAPVDKTKIVKKSSDNNIIPVKITPKSNKKIYIQVIGNHFNRYNMWTKDYAYFMGKFSKIQQAILSNYPYSQYKDNFVFIPRFFQDNAVGCKIVQEQYPDGKFWTLGCHGPSIQLRIDEAYNSGTPPAATIVLDDSPMINSEWLRGYALTDLGVVVITNSVKNGRDDKVPYDTVFKTLVAHEFNHAFAGINDEYIIYHENNILNEDIATNINGRRNYSCYTRNMGGKSAPWTQGCLYQNWYRENAQNVMYKQEETTSLNSHQLTRVNQVINANLKGW